MAVLLLRKVQWEGSAFDFRQEQVAAWEAGDNSVTDTVMTPHPHIAACLHRYVIGLP